MRCQCVNKKTVFFSSPVSLVKPSGDNIIPPFSTISIGTAWKVVGNIAPVLYLSLSLDYTIINKKSIDAARWLKNRTKYHFFFKWAKTPTLCQYLPSKHCILLGCPFVRHGQYNSTKISIRKKRVKFSQKYKFRRERWRKHDSLPTSKQEPLVSPKSTKG